MDPYGFTFVIITTCEWMILKTVHHGLQPGELTASATLNMDDTSKMCNIMNIPSYCNMLLV